MGNACSGMKSERTIVVMMTPSPPVISEEGHIEKNRFTAQLKESYSYFGKMESLLVQEQKLHTQQMKDETTDNTSIVLAFSGSQLMGKMKSNQGSKLSGLIGSSESLLQNLNRPISNQSVEKKSSKKKLTRVQTDVDRKYELFENLIQKYQTLRENDSFRSFDSFHSAEQEKNQQLSVLEENLRPRCQSAMVVAVKGILKKELKYNGNKVQNGNCQKATNNKKVQWTGLEHYHEKTGKQKYKKELESVGFRRTKKTLLVKVEAGKNNEKLKEISPSPQIQHMQKYMKKGPIGKRQSQNSVKSPSGKKATTPCRQNKQQQKSKY